jgi:hypothetical protein
MAERKVKVKFEGKDMDVWDVPIEESIERWTELRLEDGAVLRVKVVVSNVFRLLDKDEQGNPRYAINSTNAVVLGSPPKKLSDRTVQ